jgi:UDP-glucuronate decarboxylase
MNILVTGGAGFIGSHLCKKLVDEGNHVFCLDNMYTGTYTNIADLLKNPNFDFINASVTDEIKVEVEQIYNLACPASPIHYQYDPVMTMKTSILGAMRVLDLARKCQATVLQASTSEVYGDPLKHPQNEEYWGNVNPIGIRACYDEGKRAAETLFFDYHRQYGVNIKVVRIFNTYGPNMAENDGRVVSNFIVQALSGKKITIYGDGSQTRSFCYVSDLVDGLIRMMNSDAEIIGPINIGNPVEKTVLELAKMIITLTDSSSEIVIKDLPQDDPLKRKPDISKAEQLLDWRPLVPLEEGLKKTINYFEGD